MTRAVHFYSKTAKEKVWKWDSMCPEANAEDHLRRLREANDRAVKRGLSPGREFRPMKSWKGKEVQ